MKSTFHVSSEQHVKSTLGGNVVGMTHVGCVYLVLSTQIQHLV